VSDRRLVGIDLGIASAHAVRILNGEGVTLAKRKAWPTVASLTELESVALQDTPAGTRLEIVMEPTGPAWLPIAVFFVSRGHVVYRVSSAESAALRRYLSRHAKTNGIDADTLARIPLVNPRGVQPLVLADANAAALDRRVRATDRLTRTIAEHKTRIKALVRQLMPMSPLTGKMTRADMAVLERWADPNLLVKAGPKRVGALIAKASRGHTTGTDRAQEWIDAANAAVELYGDHPAVAFTEIAAEIASEVRLTRATMDELELHAAARETPTRRSILMGWRAACPGWLISAGRRWSRRWVIRHGSRPPNSSGRSPGSPREHQRPVTATAKANRCPRLVRRCCAPRSVRAADTARKQDPQLARIYYVQMVERGKNHLGALCVVAAALAERAWIVMNRQTPYIVCDNDGTEVTAAQAATIITEQWTVTEDVRGRRRNKKGKAPQTGEKRRHRRSDLPQPESLTSHPNNVNPDRDKHRLTPQPA
jgi:transposase